MAQRRLIAKRIIHTVLIDILGMGQTFFGHGQSGVKPTNSKRRERQIAERGRFMIERVSDGIAAVTVRVRVIKADSRLQRIDCRIKLAREKLCRAQKTVADNASRWIGFCFGKFERLSRNLTCPRKVRAHDWKRTRPVEHWKSFGRVVE